MGVCIGVDVAKKHLDWVLGPNGEVERIDNTAAAVRRLVRRLKRLDFDRVVLESTGQYERLLFEALEDEGIPVSRVNPFRVRRFGEGMGVLAKNDSIDARLLALFGEKVEPEQRPKKTERERLLCDLSARRRQLIANMTAEKNRLEHTSGYVAERDQESDPHARAAHREAGVEDRRDRGSERASAGRLRAAAIGAGHRAEGGADARRRSPGARAARSTPDLFADRPGALRPGQWPEDRETFDPRRSSRSAHDALPGSHGGLTLQSRADGDEEAASRGG